jgi:hypothetical protein
LKEKYGLKLPKHRQPSNYTFSVSLLQACGTTAGFFVLEGELAVG